MNSNDHGRAPAERDADGGAGGRCRRARSGRARRDHGVRGDLDPQHAYPRRDRAPQPHPVRAGAQRGRRHEHGGCLCARVALARRGHHQHRNSRGQCGGLAGRGAHGRLAGATHHLADRPPLHGPRSCRDPRRAAPGRHAARDLEGVFPGLGRPYRGRDDRGGRACRLERAARTGIARDPDRRAARDDPVPDLCQHRQHHAAGGGSVAARRARRARRTCAAADALARWRRARGRRGGVAAA